jgi:hypothetical protein
VHGADGRAPCPFPRGLFSDEPADLEMQELPELVGDRNQNELGFLTVRDALTEIVEPGDLDLAPGRRPLVSAIHTDRPAGELRQGREGAASRSIAGGFPIADGTHPIRR